MAHFTNFSFEFFYKIFAEDASQSLLYHGAKKSKMTKNSNQGGGPALIVSPTVRYICDLPAQTVITTASWLVYMQVPVRQSCPIYCHVPISCHNTDLWPLQHATLYCCDLCFLRSLKSVFSDQRVSSEHVCVFLLHNFRVCKNNVSMEISFFNLNVEA